MKKVQSAKYGMYKAVANHFKDHAEIVNSVPALKAVVVLLNDLITSVQETISKSHEKITGVAANKIKMRGVLSRQACTIANSLFAYAEKTGDLELKEKTRFSLTDFKRLKTGELTAICTLILNLATEHLAGLADFGITAELLTSYRQNITDYHVIEKRPRNFVTRRTNFYSNIDARFSSIDTLLKNQADKIMTGLIETEPAFYSTYVNNRIIVDSNSTATQIKGIVTDAATKAPMYGATITLIETKQITSSAPDGTYSIRTPKPKTYSVSISKPGYKSKIATVIVVKLGKISRVNFKLVAEEEISDV